MGLLNHKPDDFFDHPFCDSPLIEDPIVIFARKLLKIRQFNKDIKQILEKLTKNGKCKKFIINYENKTITAKYIINDAEMWFEYSYEEIIAEDARNMLTGSIR